MPKQIKNHPNRSRPVPVAPRVPSWWADEVKSTRAVAVCTRCHAIYYDKHWHTWSNRATKLPAEHPITESLCHACSTITAKRGANAMFGYVGEVMLSGLSEGPRKQEILKTVRNVGTRAVKRNPEDQIVKIEDRGTTVRITTTENQLAVVIGKQVDRAYKGGALTIRWSKRDLPARVFWKSK